MQVVPFKDPEKQRSYWRDLYAKRRNDPAYRSIQNAAGKRWKAKHPTKAKDAQRQQDLKRKYGLSPDEFRTLFENQEGLCGVCSRLMCMCKARCLRRAEVDHDHSKRGRESVRGILCGSCNRGLGFLRDRQDLCVRAAAYLGGA